jgi:outer membrane receptor protein involved in Fe transport
VRRPLWAALVIVPSLVLTARCARADERPVRSTSTSSSGGTVMPARALGARGTGGAASLAAVTSSTMTPAIAPAVSVRGRVLFDPSATTSRLDDAALVRARAEGTTLAELVDRLPGARVLDDGGPLQARRLTVRGGTPAQAQVVVDGLPLAAPFSTGLDVGILGTEAIARATLVRGGAGALLGDGALSGALWIETRTPREQAPLVLLVRGGTLERLGLAVSAALPAVALSAEVDRSGGRFPYVSRLAGLPDVARVRENNDVSSAKASARSSLALAGGRLELLAGGAVREGGVPGFETQADLTARERRSGAVLRAAWDRALGEAWDVDVVAQGTLLDVGYEGGERPERTTFGAGSGELGVSVVAGGHRVRLSGGVGLEGSRSTEHGDPRRARGHLVLSDRWAPSEVVRVVGALRAAVDGELGAVVLPRVGATWALHERAALGLAVGRSYRAPALDELYHPTTSGFAGNPRLRPEDAWEGELSLRLRPHALLRVALAGFVRRVGAGIVYVNQNAFTVRPENVGEASVAGGELEAELGLDVGALRWEASVAASATASRLDVSGVALPTAPPLSLDLELRASWRRGPLALSAYTRGAAVSGTSANLAGTVPVDAYARWDAGAAVALQDCCTLGVAVDNLLDDRTLESVFKVPLPGRTLLATLRVEAG